MKNKKWLCLLAAPLMLAACGPTTPTGDVDSIMAGFYKTSAELVSPVKLTYTAEYKVDVISEKGGMDSFKHDVKDSTVAELDLTSGNLYAHVLRNGSDTGVTTKSEALVYKTGADYFFVTTTMENPVKLKDEAAARDKINDLLGRVSYNLAGKVTLDSLVYQKDNVYEHREFGLDTANIAKEDFAEPTYAANDKKGVTVTADFDYFGYKTDGGISDFPGKDGKPASSLTLNTDEKGRVLSYNQTLDAALAMAIMNPAPLVTIKGAKNLTATYDAAITKLETIDHHLTEGTLKISDSSKGIIEVYVGTEASEASCTKRVKTGDKIVVGQYLGVIVKPAGKNTIRNVSNNDVTVVDPKANTMYFFEVQEGENSIGANYVGEDVNPDAAVGTIIITAPEGVTTKLVSFKLDGQNAGDFQPVTDGKIDVGRWAGIAVTVPEGKEVDTVTANGKETQFIANQYCFQIKEAGEYQVIIKLKGETAPEPADTKATLIIVADDGVTCVVKSFLFTGAPSDWQDVPADGRIEPGRWYGITVTAPEGKEVEKVVCDGKEAMFVAGQYCIEAKEAKIYKAFIHLKGEPAPVEKGTIAIEAPEGVTATAVSFILEGQNPSDFAPLPANNKVAVGRFVGIKVTLPEGKEINTVKANGEDTLFIANQYCFPVKAGITYTVVITLK